MSAETINTNANLLWSVAELLRGDFKQHEYGGVILPFVLIRRLDCLLEGNKEAVRAVAESLPPETDPEARDAILQAAAGGAVYNTSPFTLQDLFDQKDTNLRPNLINYLAGFSANVRDVLLERFKLPKVLQ
ncbi:type I restriction-modification system subunit M N-terminal domain-containing protein [Rubellimicrobium rubrum]|uniref:type I restriction-modification system subunit M N-terminal domain-containing protein n=1 Tax=Rubellimicrobium rubrum TaxID=2585369 RepID=UPI00159BCA8C|nr:type I restriction-modification system subunit M N-terminal domain-containing protein [Rubellimicrobium rubrum]